MRIVSSGSYQNQSNVPAHIHCVDLTLTHRQQQQPGTLQIRPSIEFFDVGDEVLPGITAARDAPWHTPGSIIFRISGGSGVPVFFLGTAVIDEQIGFGHPYIKISTDADQAASPIGRIELLDAIVAEKGLAVPSHVAFPGLGQVVPNGVYFDFFRIPPPTSVAVRTTCPQPVATAWTDTDNELGVDQKDHGAGITGGDSGVASTTRSPLSVVWPFSAAVSTADA